MRLVRKWNLSASTRSDDAVDVGFRGRVRRKDERTEEGEYIVEEAVK